MAKKKQDEPTEIVEEDLPEVTEELIHLEEDEIEDSEMTLCCNSCGIELNPHTVEEGMECPECHNGTLILC